MGFSLIARASKGNAHPGRADEMGIFSTRAKIGSAIARHNGNVLEHYSLRAPLGSQTIPKPTATQVLLLPTLRFAEVFGRVQELLVC
jgi:hypothetical protein